jgi:hypothetical protein
VPVDGVVSEKPAQTRVAMASVRLWGCDRKSHPTAFIPRGYRELEETFHDPDMSGEMSGESESNNSVFGNAESTSSLVTSLLTGVMKMD